MFQNFHYFKKNTEDFEYLNSLRYSDWALGEFFKKQKKQIGIKIQSL